MEKQEKYTTMEKSKIQQYLQSQHYPEETIFPIMHGYQSPKYNYGGVLNTQRNLLWLRFGQPSGITVWNPKDKETLDWIIESVGPKALTEWIFILD